MATKARQPQPSLFEDLGIPPSSGMAVELSVSDELLNQQIMQLLSGDKRNQKY